MNNQIYKYPIVNSSYLLEEAKKNKSAVGHFNAMNLIYIKAILAASHELKTPIIIAVTEAKLKFLGGIKNFKDMVINIINVNNYNVPISIHLDHSYSIKNCIEAIKLGFSSVMYDGSKLKLEENINNLKQIIPFAKKYNVSIEAEIGSIGGTEDGVTGIGINAKIEDAKKMRDVNIDLLAAGVGNIHGEYPKEWKELNFSLISKIKNISNKYLVLHGASGIPDIQIKKAINLGINKINVSSELNWIFGHSLKNKFIKNEIHNELNWFDPRNIFENVFNNLYKKVIEKIKLFNNK